MTDDCIGIQKGIAPLDLGSHDPRIRVAGELIRDCLQDMPYSLVNVHGFFDPPLDNGDVGEFGIQRIFYDRDGNLSHLLEGNVYLQSDGSLDRRGAPNQIYSLPSMTRAIHEVQFNALITMIGLRSRYSHYRAEFERAIQEASSRRAV